MADGAADPATLSAYADAQARLEHAGGYRWRDGIDVALRGLGFVESELDRPLVTFSGGELTRASLARALAAKPDLLLLDEPTNHLDIGSLEWLESYLIEVDAAVILVAHDRWFLESVGTAVLELEAGRARYFAGPWHAWRTEQAARELAAGRDSARRQAEIARLERFVERFRYKATKARQAQSKLKQIDRIRSGAIETDPRDRRTLAFSFGDAERSGKVVLELEDARIEVGDRTLIEDAGMWLERGEHVCLVGANGSGKTTLLETLVGEREADGAKLRRGHNAKVGYLSQHQEIGGDAERHPAVPRAARDRALGGEDAGAARPLPVQRRRRRQAPRRRLRRRGPAAGAGAADAVRRQRARPGRADQPPRPREPRGARGRAHRLRRDRCCWSRTTGRCSRPSARARW